MPEFYSENRLSNSDKGKFFIYGFFTEFAHEQVLNNFKKK